MSTAIAVREAVLADALAIARVNVATWRSTYAGLLPADFLARLSAEQRAAGLARRLAEPGGGQFIYVAHTPSGAIVGHVSGGPEGSGDVDYTGELYALYVVASSQRQGIGQRLLRQGATRLAADGRGSLLIWVLAANPARAFYEVLGGRLVRTRTSEIGGVRLEEVGYGWRDTTFLTGAAETTAR